MNLHILVIVPLITALLTLISKELKVVRMIAFCGSALQLVLSMVLLNAFMGERAAGNTAPMLYYSSYEWFPSLGITYSTGVDGISIANVHLSHGQMLNRRQLRAIAEGTQGPTVIIGDCNAVGPIALGGFSEVGPRNPTHKLKTRLDRCLIRADDAMLLDSGLGWAGRRVLASLWFASGTPLSEARRTALVDAARSLIEMGEANPPINGIYPHLLQASVSAAQSGLVVLRVLGLRVEPVQDLIRAIRMQWRALAWSASRHTPRIWGT